MPPRKKPRVTTSDTSVQVTRPTTRGAVPKQPYYAPTMRRRSKNSLDGILGALLDLPVEVELEVCVKWFEGRGGSGLVCTDYKL